MTHFAIQREGSQRTCRIATAGVFLALALFMPARWLTGTYFPSARVAYPDPLYDLCTWMRDNTPTQPYPDGQPTYSVLASWTGGHPITVIGHRANVANGFVGWEETRESSLLPYRFFTETDPDKAMSLLRSCKARYVILGDMISSGEFARVIDILDLRHENFFQSNPTPSGTLFSPTPLLRTTMAARLFFHDAAGMENDFHLVYASPCLHSNGKPVLKLFEVINQPPSL